MEGQKERLLEMFRANGNRLTLGQIMQTTLAAEYRARLSELRREGFTIDCIQNRQKPTENLYILTEHVKYTQVYFHKGQGVFIFE